MGLWQNEEQPLRRIYNHLVSRRVCAEVFVVWCVLRGWLRMMCVDVGCSVVFCGIVGGLSSNLIS